MRVTTKHVLYTVLDWGLGHATRSVPIIQGLIERGALVSLAGEGYSLELLKRQFPNLNTYPLQGIRVETKSHEPDLLWLSKLAVQLPLQIRREHNQFIRLCNELQPDVIVSDNRYGAWHPQIHSVLICHQLQLPMPGWAREIVQPIYTQYLNRFSECWVPDLQDAPGISGILSRPASCTPPVKRIGMLSRLNKQAVPEGFCPYELLVLLSGPEPQRGLLEKKLITEISQRDIRTLLIPGREPIDTDQQFPPYLHVLANPNPQELALHLSTARFIVCRSGYSTLMDLAKLGRSARCIPTPGQPEQEYLGKLHSQRNWIQLRHQHEPSLLNDLESLERCTPGPVDKTDLLGPALTELLAG